MSTLPLITRAHTDPSGVGITSDVNGSATWAEAADVVLRLAERIRTFDLGDVRRVMVVARNRPSTVVAHAAALLGEAAAVPVNFHLTAGEIEYQVTESRALLMFVDGATEASRRNNAETIDAVSIRQSQQDHVAASNTASTFLHGDKLCA